MVGAQSYVTHTHTYCLMALVGQCSGLENTVVGAQSYVTHTHTYCLMALVGQCSG